MSARHYHWYQTLMHKVASTPAGVWFFSRTLPSEDRFLFRLTGGRYTVSSILTGLPVVTMTTTGAKSGLPRTVPLLYIRDDQNPGSFALIGSNWGQKHSPSWYHNLKAHPRATCTIDGQTKDYVAQEVSGEAYERFWQHAVNTYLGFPLYKQRAGRRIPILVMTPAS